MTAIRAKTDRRRTFAIISYPDAGKTTLTEKLLLYSGAIAEAGAVRARAWRQRGVALHRLRNEIGAQPQFEPARCSLARRTDGEGRGALAGTRGVEVTTRTDGTLLALFTSESWLDAASRDLPHITLDPIIEL